MQEESELALLSRKQILYQAVSDDDKLELGGGGIDIISSTQEESEFKNSRYKILSLWGLSISLPLLVYMILKRNILIRQGVPLSKIIPFRPISHPDPATPLWGTVTKPFPTGAFWTNLVVKNGDLPVAVAPYGVKTLDVGIQVSYGVMRRVVTQYAISDNFGADLQISSAQAYMSRSVESYDSISVTMLYKTVGNSRYRTHLVKGSPFITVVYEGATPVISSPMKIVNVEARVVKGSTGVQYVVSLGNLQKWLIYCSEPVAFTWKDDNMIAPAPIRGFVRVAILPLRNADSAFNTLLSFVQRYPTGGSVDLACAANAAVFPVPSNTPPTQIIYQFSSVGVGPLLMLALPHHSRNLIFPTSSTNETRQLQSALGNIYSIKGKLRPVVGDVWKINLNMVNVGWNYVVSDKISIAQMDEIGRSLISDVNSLPPTASDPYSFGKSLGRMAQLAVLADNLGIADARQQAVNTIATALTPWLQGNNQNPLLYDNSYGGVVTTNGIADFASDFGAGWYNDHHFHFGYFLYAGAVLSRFGGSFFEMYRSHFDSIARDICNPDPKDTDFPFARHKDLFDGHSWASGILPQGNGKNQESSSEAANAYYACYLYGTVNANPLLQRFAHVLLSMEVQAAQTYWHMPNDDIYDGLFSSGRMVGSVGGLDVSASTWFGSQLEYVHGINIMPLTPVTAFLLDVPFVQQQWTVLGNKLRKTIASPECSANAECVKLGMQGRCCPSNEGLMLACCGGNSLQPEWRGFIYAVHAVVDRDTAWEETRHSDGFGIGGSKCNSLFWAASRSAPLAGYNASTHAPQLSSFMKQACTANSACDAAGLVGNCCPADNGGLSLGCCPRVA